MKKHNTKSKNFTELRKRTKALVENRFEDIHNLSAPDILELIQDLRTHQVELERQNEELRNAQEVLRESRERYFELYNFAPVGYITLDEKGIILDANLTMADMLGVERERLIKSPLSRFVHKEDVDALHLFYKQISAKKERESCRLRLLRKPGGTKFWAELIGNFFLGDVGNAHEIRLSISDISHRIQTEKALRLDESRLEALLKLSHMTEASLQEIADFVLEEAISLTGSKIGFLGFMNENESVLNVHFWSESVMKECAIAVKGEPIHFPIDKAGLWGEVIRRRKPIMINDLTAPHPAKKGHPKGHIPILRYLSVPIFEKEKIVAMIGVGNKAENYDKSDVRQLTLLMTGVWKRVQRQKADEKVRLLSKVFLEANDPIIILDLSGKIVDLNPEVERSYGWSRKELIGKPLFSFIPTEREGQLEKIMGFCLGGIGVRNIEGQRLTKNGEMRNVLLTLSLITEESGKPIAIANVAKDITLHKKMEQEIIKAEKLGALGVFAGGIAHDFRNTIQGMLFCIHILKSELKGKGKTIGKNLEIMEKMCLSAKDLTGQLITFSKGGIPVIEICYISHLVKETVDFALHGTSAKSIYSIPDDIWPCKIDAGQISHVLNNIIINSTQAMPKGGNIEIKLKNAFLDKEEIPNLKVGKYVAITISDQGSGISAAVMPKIFDPFFTTKEEGSGLGLTTAYSIIKKHEGRITAESEPDKGTTIRIYLPAGYEKKTFRKRTKKSVPLKINKILFMDDEEDIQYFACQILSKKGVHVVCACDGIEAVELYKKAKDAGEAFDIVVLDLTVPGGMGGEKAIKKLLEIDPCANAIVSSAYSNSPVIANYKEYGFRGVLHKPYIIKDFGSWGETCELTKYPRAVPEFVARHHTLGPMSQDFFKVLEQAMGNNS